jgi:hypothetical protein
MNINKAYKSNYLKAADIDEEEVVVTIAEDVQMQEINGDEKPILYFNEFEQGLVLNKTNASTISQVLNSSETKDWVGKQIVLFVATVDFQGKATEAIRVKLRAPRAAAAARPTAPARNVAAVTVTADDIPF